MNLFVIQKHCHFDPDAGRGETSPVNTTALRRFLPFGRTGILLRSQLDSSLRSE